MSIASQDADRIERTARLVQTTIEYAMRSAERRERAIFVWRLGDSAGAGTVVPEGAKWIGTAHWRSLPSGRGWAEWVSVA